MDLPLNYLFLFHDSQNNCSERFWKIISYCLQPIFVSCYDSDGINNKLFCLFLRTADIADIYIKCYKSAMADVRSNKQNVLLKFVCLLDTTNDFKII